MYKHTHMCMLIHEWYTHYRQYGTKRYLSYFIIHMCELNAISYKSVRRLYAMTHVTQHNWTVHIRTYMCAYKGSYDTIIIIMTDVYTAILPRETQPQIFDLMLYINSNDLSEWFTIAEYRHHKRTCTRCDTHAHLVARVGTVLAATRAGNKWRATLTMGGMAEVANFWIQSALVAGTTVGFHLDGSNVVACVVPREITINNHEYIRVGTYHGRTSAMLTESVTPSTDDSSAPFKRAPMNILLSRR